MSKTNKTMINTLVKNANKNNIELVKIGEIDGTDVNIEIKKSISMEEFYSVCAALSNPPFVKNNEGISIYVPSAEVTGFKVALIKAFVPNIELPNDVVKAYEICTKLNLFQKIHNVLKDTDMYNDLLAIAERYSEYHRLMNSGLSTIENALSNNNMVETLENITSGFSEKLKDSIHPDITTDINA